MMGRDGLSRARWLTIAILALPVAACQTLGADALVASVDRAELTPQAASAIASDMVGRLAEHVGPGTGTIVLSPDGSAFGNALEEALRGWGYAVASGTSAGEGSAIPLAYVMESFEGTVLARLSTRDLDLGRAYAVTDAGASPSSPLSVMRRG